MRLLLRLIHTFYSFYLLIGAYRAHLTRSRPAPIHAPRRRVPKHLALLFSHIPQRAAEDRLIDCVTRVVDWCRTAGIRKLTVYDEHGVLLHCASRIEQRVQNKYPESDSSASEVEYPLTPPPSDYTDSRPLSPVPTDSHVITIEIPHRVRNKHNLNVRKRSNNRAGHISKPVTLCIISRNSAKPAVATAACSFLQAEKQIMNHSSPPQITVNTLSMLLENDSGLSPPDFMIVHSIDPHESKAPLELHGFPPWHIRLTEIHHKEYPARPMMSEDSYILEEDAFSEALDEYAIAEFRFGT
ncbi:hypothetical protein APHAL10511_006411 [Amanita phalloides]|nr:hypothetical protein APHAL10511_006411 [Amanita phalloides]